MQSPCKRKIRIGVVGCGHIATDYHGPAIAEYAKRPDAIERVVCCDQLPSRATQFASNFGFTSTENNAEGIVEKYNLDAVCVYVSERSMADVACMLAATGVSLLLEKPPGRTSEELARIIEASSPHQLLVSVAFNRRYMPLVEELRRLMAKIDEPVDFIQYQMLRCGRNDEDFSATAVHGLDLVATLGGSEYSQAALTYQAVEGEGPTVSNLYVSGRLTNGTVTQLAFCPMAGSVAERVSVQARRHSFELSLPIWNSVDTPGQLRHFVDGKLSADTVGTVKSSHVDFGFFGEDAAFFDAVRKGRVGNDDLHSARNIVAIAESMRRRQSTWGELSPVNHVGLRTA